MATKEEQKLLSDVLFYETPHEYGRKTYLAEGAVQLGDVLKAGTSATTERTRVDDATGAVCVALSDAADGEQVVVLEKGPAIVRKGELRYFDAATAGNKNTLDGLLLSNSNILVREGTAHS